MDACEVSSWREFDAAVAAASRAGPRAGRAHSSLVFRGLARSSYSNRHSLARLGDDYRELERHLIRNFRKYAHRERPGATVWDWLSLAQHHGLPTRLLDWTFSPFVAAHFATATSPDQEAIVWAVDCAAAHELLPDDVRRSLQAEGATVFTTELLAHHAATLDELERIAGDVEPFVLFFEPPSLDDRIVNQSAVLSTLSEPEASMDDWIEQHPRLLPCLADPARRQGGDPRTAGSGQRDRAGADARPRRTRHLAPALLRPGPGAGRPARRRRDDGRRGSDRHHAG